jgi:hypothetical protein
VAGVLRIHTLAHDPLVNGIEAAKILRDVVETASPRVEEAVVTSKLDKPTREASEVAAWNLERTVVSRALLLR